MNGVWDVSTNVFLFFPILYVNYQKPYQLNLKKVQKKPETNESKNWDVSKNNFSKYFKRRISENTALTVYLKWSGSCK